VAGGNKNIVGLMIESHINAGKQKLEPGVTKPADLK
jgi:phospho-2-dehydro-3-deoxyheptonate aldolase